jgi:hypothetical protein
VVLWVGHTASTVFVLALLLLTCWVGTEWHSCMSAAPMLKYGFTMQVQLLFD